MPTEKRTVKKKNLRRQNDHAGMALMLVLVLIAFVTGAGVFAAQSAGMEVRSAGYIRQAGQTHYVAEAGALAAMDEMRQNCSAYLSLMQQQAAGATTPTGLAEPLLRYRFGMSDFSRTGSLGSLFRARAVSGPGLEGALGVGALTPDFVASVTVSGSVTRPLFGFSAGSSRDMSFPVVNIEVASAARTSVPGTGVSLGTTANTVGIEEARVLAVVPCL